MLVRIIFLLVFISFTFQSYCQYRTELSDNILLVTELDFLKVIEDSTKQDTLYYSNGTVKICGKHEENKKTGIWTAFYENGKLSSRGIVSDGFPIGFWKFYYPNGNLKAEGKFSLGKFELGCAGSDNYVDAPIMDSLWKFWNESGSIKRICSFHKNQYNEEELTGRFISYYSNNIKKEEGNYKKGTKKGAWTYWHNNGNKQREEFYEYRDCGLYDYNWYECPSGKWIYYNLKGKIVKMEIYEEGEAVKVIVVG